MTDCKVVWGVEVCFFEVVVDCVFVFLGYVEDEGSQSRVAIVVILSGDCSSADGNDQACCCFSDFDSRCVNCGDGCFFVF